MFSGSISETWLDRMGKIYIGKPMKTKSRKELIASLKPQHLRFLRSDNGDFPDGYTPLEHTAEPGIALRVIY
jgi:hypothetical protein